MAGRDDLHPSDDPYGDHRDGAPDETRPGRRHATRPARPAWDAMTYGVPVDTRRPSRGPEPPAPGPPAAPEPYGSYPAPPSSSSPSPSYGSAGTEPYGGSSPAASTYPAVADIYPAAASDHPEAPGSHLTGPALGSYAPESYTTFRAPPTPEPVAAQAEEPVYVASGLYLDEQPATGDARDTPQLPAGGYPGGLPEPTGAPPPPRAKGGGRNLPAAIGVGVALGAVVIASLFVWRPLFLGVIVLGVGVGVWELVRALRGSGPNPPMFPLVAGGVLMVVLAWFTGADGLTFGLLVTVIATMVWRFADGARHYGRDVTTAILVAVYVPFLAGFAAMLASPPDGAKRVVATLLAVVLSDTGGYIIGAKLGRHPMAPAISPKKSWEGLAGSLGAAALGSALVIWLMFDVAPWWGLLFGLAISVAAVLGDLAESMIKRDLGVKDMSGLLPGHGGAMDRLDSILFAAPTGYLLLATLVPVA